MKLESYTGKVNDQLLDRIKQNLKNIKFIGQNMLGDVHNLTMKFADENNAEEIYNNHISGKQKDKRKFNLLDQRGFCLTKQNTTVVVIFFTKYETVDSLFWLIYHELAHYAIRNTPFLIVIFKRELEGIARKMDIPFDRFINDLDFLLQDEIHEIIPEEIFANRIAQTYTGKNFDIKWWRDNIKKVDGEIK